MCACGPGTPRSVAGVLLGHLGALLSPGCRPRPGVQVGMGPRGSSPEGTQHPKCLSHQAAGGGGMGAPVPQQCLVRVLARDGGSFRMDPLPPPGYWQGEGTGPRSRLQVGLKSTPPWASLGATYPCSSPPASQTDWEPEAFSQGGQVYKLLSRARRWPRAALAQRQEDEATIRRRTALSPAPCSSPKPSGTPGAA